MKPKGPVFVVSLFSALALPACSFIPATPGSANVRLETAERVKDCEHLGSTQSNVLSEVIGISRSDAAIGSDLFRVSANSAADMGGNVLVPLGQPDNGRQKFDVYRCR